MIIKKGVISRHNFLISTLSGCRVYVRSQKSKMVDWYAVREKTSIQIINLLEEKVSYIPYVFPDLKHLFVL